MPRRSSSASSSTTGSRASSESSSASSSSAKGGSSGARRKRKQPELDTATVEECAEILHRLISKAQELTDRDIWNHELGIDKSNRNRKKKRATEKEEDLELMHEADLNTEYRHLEEQPSIIEHGTLRPYQLAGVNWMVNLRNSQLNGILADEMGLGKTLQTISLLAYLRESEQINGPHLVSVPKSTLPNWCREFSRWCSVFSVLPFEGDKETRRNLISERVIPGDFDVLICSYEVLMIEKSSLKKIEWNYIVVDEAHRLKNESSKFACVLRTFSCANKLLITGTPLQNNLRELWSLLNFLLPQLFDSAADFEQLFNVARSDEEQEQVFKSLRFLLQPFLLRRLKTQVEKDLPPKKEVILFVGMSEIQRDIYKKILLRDVDSIGNEIISSASSSSSKSKSKTSKTRLLNIVMQLRKCCNHPYLFEGVEDMTQNPFGQHLINNAGKLHLLYKLLPRLKANGSRCLIFSQMTRVLDILEDFCRILNYRYCRLDGSTSGEDRQKSMDEFNEAESPYFLFLLSTRAGGLGLNLQTADIVIIYDSDWNPQMDLQAMDRVHRIGQTKPVFVYRLVTSGTVEERILERAELKLRLDAMVIQKNLSSNRIGGSSASSSNKGTGNKQSLLEMISYGASEMFKSDSSTITDADIDLILSQGEAQTQELKAKWEHKTQRRFDELKSEFDYQTYEGQDYSDVQQQQQQSRMKQEQFDLYELMKSKLQGRSTRLMTQIGGAYNSTGRMSASERLAKKQRELTSYNIDERYRELMGNSTASIHGLKLPPALPDLKWWQLWNKSELEYIHQKELDWFDEWRNHPDYSADQTPKPLSEEELHRKSLLLKRGFAVVSYRDYGTFARLLTKYGRNKLNEEVIPQLLLTETVTAVESNDDTTSESSATANDSSTMKKTSNTKTVTRGVTDFTLESARQYAHAFIQRLEHYERDIRDKKPGMSSDEDGNEQSEDSDDEAKKSTVSGMDEDGEGEEDEENDDKHSQSAANDQTNEHKFDELEIADELIPALERILQGEKTIRKRERRERQILERRREREEKREAWIQQREEAALKRAQRERIKQQRLRDTEERYNNVIQTRIREWLGQMNIEIGNHSNHMKNGIIEDPSESSLSSAMVLTSAKMDEMEGSDDDDDQTANETSSSQPCCVYTPLSLPDASGESHGWSKQMDRFLFYNVYLLGYQCSDDSEVWTKLWRRVLEYQQCSLSCDFDFTIFAKRPKDCKQRVEKLVRAITASKSGSKHKKRQTLAAAKRRTVQKQPKEKKSDTVSAAAADVPALSSSNKARTFSSSNEPPKKRSKH